MASVLTSATYLIAVSFWRGERACEMTAPTAGMKTTRVNAHVSNQECIEPISPCLGRDPEDGCEYHNRCDEHERVELEPTGFDLAHFAPGLAGDRGDAVDQSVDTLLVDVVVGELARGPGAPPGVVQNVVDDVLVEPVRRRSRSGP